MTLTNLMSNGSYFLANITNLNEVKSNVTMSTWLLLETTIAVEISLRNKTADRFTILMNPLDIAYVTVTFLMSLMSIIGSVIVLFVHWSYVDLRTSGRTMLVHLTVADLLTALGNLLGVIWYLNVENLEYKMVFCKFHSALTIMSSIASFIWTVVIAWFVFWILIHMQPTIKQNQRSLSIVLPGICWAIPMVVALTALGLDVLGYDHKLAQASWCWINPETPHGMMWMLVTGKAWEFAACFLTVFLYTAAKILLFRQARIRSTMMSRKNRRMDEANTKLTFVPIVFIVIRIWGTIRFLIGSFAHEYANSSAADWIVIMQATGDSAQGFANFIMYIFFTQKIRERLFKRCHRSHSRRSHDNTHHSHSSPRKHEDSDGEPGSRPVKRDTTELPEFPANKSKDNEIVIQQCTGQMDNRNSLIKHQDDRIKLMITSASSLLSTCQNDFLVQHLEQKDTQSANQPYHADDDFVWTTGLR